MGRGREGEWEDQHRRANRVVVRLCIGIRQHERRWIRPGMADERLAKLRVRGEVRRAREIQLLDRVVDARLCFRRELLGELPKLLIEQRLARRRAGDDQPLQSWRSLSSERRDELPAETVA